MTPTEEAPLKPGTLYTELPQLQTSDMILAVFLTICAIVGILGNTTSILYFLPRRSKSVHDLLYLIISILDCVTCICVVPIFSSLFQGRLPGVFENVGFCCFFGVTLVFVLRMSIFLVVVMSVVRTIVIIKPHYVIRRNCVVAAIGIYAGWLLLIDVLFLALRYLNVVYIFTVAGCTFDYDRTSVSWATLFWFAMIQLEFMFPPFIAFTTFLISTVALFRRTQQHNDKIRRASVTISLFTATFLSCNVPCFLYQLAQLIHIIQPNNFTHSVMWDPQSTLYYVGRLWLQMFPLFLNSALNPCLYFLRMPRLRVWLFRWFTARKSHISATSSERVEEKR